MTNAPTVYDNSVVNYIQWSVIISPDMNIAAHIALKQ